MKWDEKTIPGTVNQTHMKGWGGIWLTNLMRGFSHFQNCASYCTYVRKTNYMHTFSINLFQLYYPLHVSNNSSNHNMLVTGHHIHA
jgi:hypothetical protein